MIKTREKRTINSPAASTIARAGRCLKQSIISLMLVVEHPINAPNFLAFSKEFSACVQQLNALPLTDIPPTHKNANSHRRTI